MVVPHYADTIQLSGSGKRTRISVTDWPDRHGPWRVATADDRGRQLEVVFGWHNFLVDQSVGHMVLHITSRNALLITDYRLSSSLLDGDRTEALGAMVLCSQAIAGRLQVIGVGNGCLDWQFDDHLQDDVYRLFSGFRSAQKRRGRRSRGKQYARWSPS
jgi:hypothetical protein